MDIAFTITAGEAGSLQVSVSEGGIALTGLASGRRVTVEGVFGDVTVQVLPVDEGCQPVQEVIAEVQPMAAEAIAGVESPAAVTVEASEQLFRQLVALRKQIAAEQNLPPYVIFHDSTLREMSRVLPMDLRALKAIQGVGQAKLERYGSRFVGVIREYTSTQEVA